MTTVRHLTTAILWVGLLAPGVCLLRQCLSKEDAEGR